VHYSLNLTNKKKEQITKYARQFKQKKSFKICEFARFLGILNAACPAVAYGFIHCKSLERQKFLVLKFNGENFEGKMSMKEHMLDDLSWWEKNATIGSNPIRSNKFSLEIFSDASLSGWGCFCNGKVVHGFWNEDEKKKHINYLELLAAFFALRCFASKMSRCEILLRVDNTTAISYVNRAGGVQFPHLSKLSKEIWKWCEDKNLWIKASYIPSSENIYADQASRIINIDTEWELSNEFKKKKKKINDSFGPFTVDLFASRVNKKCRNFYARFPEAEIIDAFTVDWGGKHFYAFPPFALILRTLRKIINDKAIGVVVVPYWPTQSWFPLFTSLLVKPIVLGPSKFLLTSPYRNQEHPLAAHLTLVAGILSRQRLRKKEYHQTRR